MEEGNHRPKRWKTFAQLTEKVVKCEKSSSDTTVKLQQMEIVENERTEETDSENGDIGMPVFPELGES